MLRSCSPYRPSPPSLPIILRPSLLMPEPSSLTQQDHSSQSKPMSIWRAPASREFCRSSDTSWGSEVRIWVERSLARVEEFNASMAPCIYLLLTLDEDGDVFGQSSHMAIINRVCHIRKTPKPLPFPSHVVLPPTLFRPRKARSRVTMPSPRPTTSRVSVGLIIPSSQRCAVEYSAVDWSSISAFKEECWAGSLIKRNKTKWLFVTEKQSQKHLLWHCGHDLGQLTRTHDGNFGVLIFTHHSRSNRAGYFITYRPHP